MSRLAKIALGLTVATFPAAASISALAEEMPLMITDFKFGLVCGTPDNRRVCFQTNALQISNESTCVFNQKPIQCTWYGYSFDYDAATDVKINCEASTDADIAFGNPKELLKPAAKYEFDLELKQGTHHFFVAQYMSAGRSSIRPKQGRESCSLAGKPLFSAEYQYQFPDEAEPVESVPDVSGKK